MDLAVPVSNAWRYLAGGIIQKEKGLRFYFKVLGLMINMTYPRNF
jgi:hypothetical protein